MNTKQEGVEFDVWLDALSSIFRIKLGWDYVEELGGSDGMWIEYYDEDMSPMDVYEEELSCWDAEVA